MSMRGIFSLNVSMVINLKCIKQSSSLLTVVSKQFYGKKNDNLLGNRLIDHILLKKKKSKWKINNAIISKTICKVCLGSAGDVALP